MVAGFAGCFKSEEYGGTLGRWPTETPPLAHYVGALDKLQLMKYDGMWNYEAGENCAPLGPDQEIQDSNRTCLCWRCRIVYEYYSLSVHCTD